MKYNVTGERRKEIELLENEINKLENEVQVKNDEIKSINKEEIELKDKKEKRLFIELSKDEIEYKISRYREEIEKIYFEEIIEKSADEDLDTKKVEEFELLKEIIEEKNKINMEKSQREYITKKLRILNNKIENKEMISKADMREKEAFEHIVKKCIEKISKMQKDLYGKIATYSSLNDKNILVLNNEPAEWKATSIINEVMEENLEPYKEENKEYKDSNEMLTKLQDEKEQLEKASEKEQELILQKLNELDKSNPNYDIFKSEVYANRDIKATEFDQVINEKDYEMQKICIEEMRSINEKEHFGGKSAVISSLENLQKMQYQYNELVNDIRIMELKDIIRINYKRMGIVKGDEKETEMLEQLKEIRDSYAKVIMQELEAHSIKFYNNQIETGKMDPKGFGSVTKAENALMEELFEKKISKENKIQSPMTKMFENNQIRTGEIQEAREQLSKDKQERIERENPQLEEKEI